MHRRNRAVSGKWQRVSACMAIRRKNTFGCQRAVACTRLYRILPIETGCGVTVAGQSFGAGCGVYLLLPSPMKRWRKASAAALQVASPIFA